jgi:hypothetical protein
MTGKPGGRRWLQSLIVSLATLAAALPAAAASAGTSSPLAAQGMVVTMFSDPGDYIGGGMQQEFDQTNATFSGTVSTAGINLSASGGTSGLSWSFVIDPPQGKSFRVGYYSRVQRAEFRTAGYAGLDITGDGRGCNTVSGAIEIRDLAVSGSAITRLDLLYEQHCEGGPAALFGEVRIGEPRPAGVIVSSSSVTWPAMPGLATGGVGTAVPVYVRNPGTAPVSIGTASLSGLAAGDYSIVNNTCSGTVLAPGGSCDLYLGFTARTAGPQPARLRLPLGSGIYGVQLDALVRPGTTSLTMKSQPGDYIGGGLSYDFTGSNATFTVNAAPSGLAANLSASDGEYWTVDMYPAPGTVLTVGTYANATRYPFNGNGNGLSVYGDSRGCNTLTGSFTVKQVTFSAVDNSLQNFDGTFVQHCEGAAPALTGELKYDSAPVTTPPAGVSNLSAVPSSTGLHLTWANPSPSGYRYTVVRVESSAKPYAVSPVAGLSGYAGTGTAATVHGLRTGHTYTVVAYTVDQYGNVSQPAETTVTV